MIQDVCCNGLWLEVSCFGAPQEASQCCVSALADATMSLLPSQSLPQSLLLFLFCPSQIFKLCGHY